MSEVTLKEFIEVRIAHLKELVFDRLVQVDGELKLQAKEYERRLSDLNHEQARLQADRNRFVSHDVNGPAMDRFETRIKLLELNKANSEGRSIVIASVVSVGTSVAVALVIKFFF